MEDPSDAGPSGRGFLIGINPVGGWSSQARAGVSPPPGTVLMSIGRDVQDVRSEPRTALRG